MTTLISWASYKAGHAHSPNSIYFASDSRITWGSHKKHWDGGRKVFACRLEPHIFGYCGDVVFPSLVIAQMVSAIDSGVLFPSAASAEQKQSAVLETLKKSFQRRNDAPDQDFSILHALRVGQDKKRAFSVWSIEYESKQKTWRSTPLALPSATGIAAMLGTGRASVTKYIKLWSASDVGGRSSAIFSGFCDALFSGEDKYSGGMPQICALNPGSHAQTLGFINDKAHFLHGLEMVPVKTLYRIKWFDRHFQAIDPSTMKLKAKAKRLKRPSGL